MGDYASNEVVWRPRSMTLTHLASLHEALQQSLAEDFESYEVEFENDSDGDLFSPSPLSDNHW